MKKKLIYLFMFVFVLISSVSVVSYSGVPYWIEHDENNNYNNNLWINITGGNRSYYIYYNSSGNYYGDGDKVFSFFDDFNDSSLSLKWTNNVGSYTISNSKITYNTATGWGAGLSSTDYRLNLNDGYIITYLGKTITSQALRLGSGLTVGAKYKDSVFAIHGGSYNDHFLSSDSNGNYNAIQGSFNTVNDEYYKVVGTRYANNTFNYIIYNNSLLVDNFTGNIVYHDVNNNKIIAEGYDDWVLDYIYILKKYSFNYSVDYGSEETGSWEKEGNIYYKRRLINITSSQFDFNNPIQLNYSYFNNPKIYIELNSSVEQSEQVTDEEQIVNVSLSSSSWQNIITGDFNLTYKDNVSFAFTVNAINNFQDSQLNCRINVDGNIYGSQVNRTMPVNQYGSFYLTTSAFELENGTHTASLQCRRQGSWTYFTVFGSRGIMKILRDKNTLNNLKFLNKNISMNITTTDYKLLGNFNFTISNKSVDSSVNLYKYLIIDGHLQYNYDSTGTITTKLIIKDTKNTTFEFPRYGENGDSGSLGGLRLSHLIDSSLSDNITIELWGKSTSSDGYVTGSLVVDEVILHDYSINQTSLNNTNISASSSYIPVKSLLLDNTAHASSNLVVKATIPFKTTSGNARVKFRLKIDNENGSSIYRDVANGDEYGLAMIQDVFQINSSNYNITLEATSNNNFQIFGGSFGVYTADNEPFIPKIFNVTIYNIWDNSSFNNFNVTLVNSGNTFEAINGTATIIPNNDGEDLLINGNDFFNATYYNISTNSNLSVYQNIIRIIIKHIISDNEIPYNMTLNIDNGFKELNNFSSGQAFYFNSTTHNLKINLSDYVDLNENIDLTSGLLNKTFTFYISPIIGFNFMDEKTAEPFNLSVPDKITAQVYCVNDSEVIEQVINETDKYLNLTCDYTKIKFIVDFGLETYYRTYPKITDSFDINNFNMTVWLLDLNTTSVILNSFLIYDLFGDYDNPMILFYRTIGNTTYLITGDTVDIENKISAFLIQNQQYTVKVLSDNLPEKNIGTYFADTAGESIIRLFTIDLNSTVTEFSSLVRQYIYLINDSGNIKIRAAVYTDDVSIIQNSDFTVRMNSEAGTTICYQSSIEQNVEFSCDVPDDVSNIYWAQLDIIDSSGEHHYYTRTLKPTDRINFGFTFDSPKRQEWFWNLFIIVVFVLLAFLPVPVGVKMFLFLFIMLFLNQMEWITLSNLPNLTATQNKSIASAILSVLMLLTTIRLIRK